MLVQDQLLQKMLMVILKKELKLNKSVTQKGPHRGHLTFPAAKLLSSPPKTLAYAGLNPCRASLSVGRSFLKSLRSSSGIFLTIPSTSTTIKYVLCVVSVGMTLMEMEELYFRLKARSTCRV